MVSSFYTDGLQMLLESVYSALLSDSEFPNEIAIGFESRIFVVAPGNGICRWEQKWEARYSIVGKQKIMTPDSLEYPNILVALGGENLKREYHGAVFDLYQTLPDMIKARQNMTFVNIPKDIYMEFI